MVIFARIKPLWLYNRRVEYAKTLDWILLEINLPPEVAKTPKAMENVLDGLHGAYTEIKGRTKWLEGKAGDLFSLEMAGTNGELHFYIRCQRGVRNFVESKIYAQYPDAEIREVEDYTAQLPPDIPNKDYKLWGADMMLVKHWAYPLKTYLEFEDIEEERRLDPISQYAEMISKMEEGEHMWLQILISPLLKEVGKEAQNIRDELVGRKKPKKKSMMGELGTFFVEFFNNMIGVMVTTGEPTWSGESKSAETAEFGMQTLTPGEQKIIEKIEIKQGKTPFGVAMRMVYIARNDVYHGEHISAFMGFLRQFSGLNSFKPESKSKPSSSLIFFKNQRNHLRTTRLYNAYRGRMLSVFAQKPYVLGTDELATIYHFPGRVVHAPFMPRIKSRTSEPPKNLPL